MTVGAPQCDNRGVGVSPLHRYAKAGAIAQENLAGVRTVQAFGGQREALAKYRAELEGTCKVCVDNGG